MAHIGFRALSVLAVSFTASIAVAGPGYSLVSSFELPQGIDTMTVDPSGLLMATSGNQILRQDSLRSGSFSPIGSLPAGLLNAFGASFISVSPGGQTIAIGDNNLGSGASVLLLPSSNLTPDAPTTPTAVPALNFNAAWSDDTTLFVTGGEFGSPSVVTAIDVPTGTGSVVIDNIDGGSSGIAISGGRLFTGNGFAYGNGSSTGDIFAFELDALGAGPLDFLSGGSLVAHALSAGSLGFDAQGNLLVGGGDFSGEIGFAAVIEEGAIQASIAGGPIATSAAGQRLSPVEDPAAFYSILFNPVTEELYVTTFGDSTVFVYAIPAPGTAAMLALIGTPALRRRRG